MTALRPVVQSCKSAGPDHRRGFTLMELVVAISVSILMLALISRIFFDTTEAVSRGVTISDATQISRAISQQLHEDAGKMIGPGDTPAGFLVIVQQLYPEVRVNGPDRALPSQLDNTWPAGDVRRNWWPFRDVRSDQLMFFIQENEEHAISLVPQSNNSFSSTPVSQIASHFHGEARVWYGHLQQSDDLLGTDTEGNPDRFATNWILGRQALWLVRDDYGVATVSPDPAIVSGSYSYLFPGITDAQSANWDIGRALTYDASMDHVWGLAAWSDPVYGLLALANLSLGNRESYYSAIASSLAYMDDNRLRVRSALEPGNAIVRDDIAQMHAYLAHGVSDFIVEFAGDYDGTTSGIDRFSDGSIRWYGHFLTPSNRAEQYDPYTALDVERPGSGFSSAPMGPYYIDDPNVAVFVFPHDVPESWPHLIRIRYRVHDQNGRLMSGSTPQGLIPHSNPALERPHDQPHGMWFEQIIKVTRPLSGP